MFSPIHAFGFIMNDITPSVLVLNPELRRQIEQAVHAESHMCWTCSSCANECPVNLATGRLQPNKIVRMANLGLFDELLRTPEIRYCQQCNRCNQVCPMKVRPADLIAYARYEAARRKLISYETARKHQELYGRFQRAKWHMFLRCLRGESPRFSKTQWYDWLNIPIPPSAGKIFSKNPSSDNNRLKGALSEFAATACFTCGECSSACPVCYERSVFEPRLIFRMANFGLAEELMQSPMIWLCIECQRCTNACSQLVKGHLIIEHLRQLSLSEGFVTKQFLLAWKDYQINIYTLLLDEIDILFGF